MSNFVVTCIDKKNALELRMATRPAHLEYTDGFPQIMRLAGPLLDDEGQMAGSLIILECDRAQAEAFVGNDPYNIAGLFESVDIREIKITRGELR